MGPDFDMTDDLMRKRDIDTHEEDLHGTTEAGTVLTYLQLKKHQEL